MKRTLVMRAESMGAVAVACELPAFLQPLIERLAATRAQAERKVFSDMRLKRDIFL